VKVQEEHTYSGATGSFFSKNSVKIGVRIRLVELTNDSNIYSEPTKHDTWKYIRREI